MKLRNLLQLIALFLLISSCDDDSNNNNNNFNGTYFTDFQKKVFFHDNPDEYDSDTLLTMTYIGNETISGKSYRKYSFRAEWYRGEFDQGTIWTIIEDDFYYEYSDYTNEGFPNSFSHKIPIINNSGLVGEWSGGYEFHLVKQGEWEDVNGKIYDDCLFVGMDWDGNIPTVEQTMYVLARGYGIVGYKRFNEAHLHLIEK